MTELNRPAEFEQNQPIPLEETDIVNIDGQSVDIQGSVVFQLHPSPRVVFESDTLSDLTRRERHKRIELRNGAQLEALLGAQYFDPDKLILIPVSQPVSVIDKGSPLQEVSFAILNFPEFYGQQDKWINVAEQNVRIPQAELETSEWRVNITGVPNIREAAKTLKRSRGHGITYNGLVTRSDGTTFWAQDVEPLLEILRVFLSIARGAACSLALVRGQDEDGRESWVRWGAHHSEPGLSFDSAFLRNNSNILSDLFPEFVVLLMDQEDKKRTTLRAFDWYLESNVSAPHVGIILTFAALEGFSNLVLYDEKDNGKSARKTIERALSKLRILLDLPKNCKSLSVLKDWDAGPQALVAIRNNLVHPQKGLGRISNIAYLETWDLGQWYFELMLLSKLGYQGNYLDRLINRHGNGDPIVPVPWAAR